MIVDGKKIADEVLAELGHSLRGKKLGIVAGSEDPATQSFIRIKTKVAEQLGVEVVRLPVQAGGELRSLVHACDGVIIQLPHPHADELIAQLPREKDVDGISPHPLVVPPVALAIEKILSFCEVTPRGQKAVVVGAGRLVGAPAAELLRKLGAEVQVLESKDSLAPLKTADIVVLGAGVSGLIKPDMLKRGVILIDAGTSESSGKVVGDADPACAEVASVFTPVPGGIGPIAVAMIFKNLFALVNRP